MAKIAFLLLCHRDPEGVVQQARRLTASGDCIAIHFDARSSRADYELIRHALADNPAVTFAPRRQRCGWGEWSLVEATMQTARAALDAFPDATHFYMVSGDCMAVKSNRYARELLDAEDADYIESHDFFASDWIRTGMKEERLIYRHWFNERKTKRLFYWSWWIQRRLGLARTPPEGLRIMIGSQWWCLRRGTLEAILSFTRERPGVVRFFRTTWIPDETFFQTLARHLVPDAEIRNRSLTFLIFTDYGMPVTFYDDHYELLLGQDALFARKISPEAHTLKARLGSLYASDRTDFEVTGEGRRLYHFLAGRGRVGRRFSRRVWEIEASLGSDRELLILACKKWHVGKRLSRAIQHHTNIPALDYIFNEEDAALPDLGGIEKTLEKRARHRRALLRMLYDWHETDRMILCLDTSSIELMRDFFDDRSGTRLLEIEASISDDFLIGHARRTGLAGEHSGPETLERLLPVLHYQIVDESERLRDAGFPSYHRLRETAPVEEQASALAGFLGVAHHTGQEIARTPQLYDD